MLGLDLRNLKKSFGSVEVIKGVDLSIGAGDFTVFVGPSGCGKSTLLRMIAGLEDVSSGGIFFDGENVTEKTPAERRVAMVFQSYALYPHMTVEQNISFALRVHGMPKAEVASKVKSAADTLRLSPYMDRKPSELSGGQKQRVAIGRAIVRDPQVFLFDEPLSNLDAELRVQMRLELAELHKRLKTTMIYVTHDQVEAMTLANRIVVLRDGLIEQFGTPRELYGNPDNKFVAGFLGSPKMNFLNASVIGKTSGEVRVRLSGIGHAELMFSTESDNELELGEVVTVGIRPEHFANSGELTLPVNVQLIEDLGGTRYAYCRGAGQHSLTVEIDRNSAHAEGQDVDVHFEMSDAFLFSGTEGRRVR